MKKKNFKLKKINLRITLYFTTLILLIGVVITIVNIMVYSKEVSDQMNNVVAQKLDLISSRLDKNLSEIQSIHSSIYNDYAINQAFQNVVDHSTDQNINTLSGLLDQRNAQINSIIAIGLQGDLYNTIRDFPAYKKLVQNNADYNDFINKKMYFKFSSPTTFPLEYINPTEQEKSNITFYGQYFNNKTLQLLGAVAINFKKSYLFNDIDSLAKNTFITTFIVDENNNIIYRVGSLNFDDSFKNLKKDEITIGDKSYHVFSENLKNYHYWRIVGVFDNSLIMQKTNDLNKIIFVILIFFIVLMLFISLAISKKITEPIKQVVLSMNEFQQGRWPMPLETNNEDEIKSLIQGYNSMLNNFIILTDNIISKHEEKNEMELDLINTRISLLEAQINPHFIHNTLNSMNYLALVEGNNRLSELIQSFNKLLRVSMAINLDLITVTQEIENIKQYEMIQSIRYENVFTIEYDIDQNVCFGKIPKLILQPIVENSIIHGILPKKKHGVISISISRADPFICVQIKDNGIGFDKENIDIIFSSGYKANHIGLKNVKDRIILLYGEENISFSIDSSTEGTIVSFTIPYKD